MRTCLSCEKEIEGHFNKKRCAPCAALLRKRPLSTLSDEQIFHAKKLIGKMSREDITKELGTSLANLKRAFRGTRLAYYNYCTINPSLVKSVNKYFESHNLNETAKFFNMRPKQIDHMVYRYNTHRPKQIKWTDKQIIEAVKMAGLISPKAQARYFNRPGAHSGSIKSLWCKVFTGGKAGSVNGMPHWMAKHLVTKKARYLKPMGQTRKSKLIEFKRLILWIDMEKCLKPEVPHFMVSAIKSMADFQRWLWKNENPKPLILKMIKEREFSREGTDR